MLAGSSEAPVSVNSPSREGYLERGEQQDEGRLGAGRQRVRRQHGRQVLRDEDEVRHAAAALRDHDQRVHRPLPRPPRGRHAQVAVRADGGVGRGGGRVARSDELAAVGARGGGAEAGCIGGTTGDQCERVKGETAHVD